MHSEHSADEAWPARLLETYLRIADHRPAGALPNTAIRTRSPVGRRLLAHAASGGTRSVDQLVAAAQGGERPRELRRSLKPAPLADLGRVMAIQEISPADLTDGLALLDLALMLFGADRISPDSQSVHAQLAYHLGDQARAEVLCRAYPELPDQVRDDLRIDLANPFQTADGTPELDWWRSFRRLLPEPSPRLLAPTGGVPFDRVGGAEVRKVSAEGRVTVVVTSFRPGDGLVTAVRSIIDQSWTNVEILIIDDGSPAEFDPVLERCRALDDRVNVVRLPHNSGTYAARNAGLDAAAGEFVTFQDSDDWSHPGRLERQVRPLLEDGSLVATISDALRVSETLVLTRPARNPRILNVSSLMLRKADVLARIGYFDRLRKGADSEYLARIGAAFGQRAVRRFQDEAYALIRQAPGSLSRAEVRAGWMHPTRIAYHSAYRTWHSQIIAGEVSPFVARDAAAGPFPSPAHLRAKDSRIQSRHYDVLFVSDWRSFGSSQRAMFDEIRVLAQHGLRVAIMQLESYLTMYPYRRPLSAPIQGLVNDGCVDQVFLSERVDVGVVVVQPPPVLQFADPTGSSIRANLALIVASAAPATLDGRVQRYSPLVCSAVVAEMFGSEPLWCPRNLAGHDRPVGLDQTRLAPFELPSTIDVDEWQTDRRQLRSDRPIIGRHSRDHWSRWPADRAALIGAYPHSPGMDVRILGGALTARSILRTPLLPANWLVYAPSQVSVRSFLFQVDFYSYFVHPACAEPTGRAVVEALAAGCVTVLPLAASSSYGHAAVYCEPADVGKVVDQHFEAPDLVRRQRGHADEWVRARYDGNAYADFMSTLV